MRFLILPTFLCGVVLLGASFENFAMAESLLIGRESGIAFGSVSGSVSGAANYFPGLRQPRGELVVPEARPLLTEVCDFPCSQLADVNGRAHFRELVVGSHSARLVRIGNDRDAAYSDLNFLIDTAGGIAALEYLTTAANGQTLKKTFTVAQMEALEGAVLEEQQGIKAIAVLAKIDEAGGVGSMRFRFVANGLTGKYKTCDVGLVRSGVGPSTSWSMRNATSGQTITLAKIVSWSFGIMTLAGICP